MKRRITYMVLSCLMVVTLVLSSCQPASVTETEETQEVKGEVTQTTTAATPSTPSTTTTPEVPAGAEMVLDSLGNMVEKPQYGGTFTYRATAQWMNFYDLGGWARRHSVSTVYDRLIEPDFAKGPAGTGELRFITSAYNSSDNAGMLAESFEMVDLNTVVFYLQEGVRYQEVAPVNGREFTSDDVIQNWEYRIWKGRMNAGDETIYSDQEDWIAERADDSRAQAWVAEVEANGIDIFNTTSPNEAYMYPTGKYIVTLRSYENNFGLYGFLNLIYMFPHELWETYPEEELNDWDIQCGTGGFRVVDHVPESSMTFERNPNYFKMDPLHPENQLPYLDVVNCLAIPDQSTYIAAIRTHKIDYASMALDDARSLIQLNPELLYDEFPPPTSSNIWVRTDEGPFSDVLVRRAIMMAIDHEAIANDLFDGHASILTYPVMEVWRYAYTPLEELPEEDRMMFEYHPEEAKALLAEAGYPNGFQTSIYAPNNAKKVQDMLIIQDYLAKVDIEVTVVPLPQTEYVSLLLNSVWIEGDPYDHMMASNFNNSGASTAFWVYLGGQGDWSGGRGTGLNMGRVVDQDFVDLFDPEIGNYNGTLDEMERFALLKPLNLKTIAQMYSPTLPSANLFVFWGPWVKRCDGAYTMGPDELTQSVPIKYYWIDQDVKYEITGQRD